MRDPLAQTLITPELLRMIAEIDEFKGRWEALGNLAPERLSTLKRIATKDERHRGSYKTLPNNVEAFDADGRSVGIIFETATPSIQVLDIQSASFCEPIVDLQAAPA